MLVYGITADCIDEYLKIGASTTLECMKNFALGVIEVFGNEYLRKPSQADVGRILQVAEVRDFPGMLGSIVACTGSGKIAPRPGRHHFKRNFTRCQLSSYKRSHRTTFGYGMHSSVYLEVSTI